MYAIVNIAGRQYRVEENKYIIVNRLGTAEGEKIEFDEVLLVNNDKAIKVGSPLLKGAKVSGTVLSHGKGDKVLVFKKKRRKGYSKQNGHRDHLTKVQIDSITI